MPKLLLKFNAAVIKEFDWPEGATSMSVGRKPDNDIVIDNPAVSSHHCKIAVKGDTYFVEDLESTNGIFVNQERVMKCGLHHRDAIGVAKHTIIFMEDNPEPDTLKTPSSGDGGAEGTVKMSVNDKAAAAAESGPPPIVEERIGHIKILKGGASEQTHYDLQGLSTYIGKSDRVQIPISGGGMFRTAPEVAASVHKKPEGYVLVAVEEGYPVVNGQKINKKTLLKDGDIIECGGTTLQFTLKNAS